MLLLLGAAIYSEWSAPSADSTSMEIVDAPTVRLLPRIADGAAADAKGALVDVEEGPHAVARAVEVVEAVAPKRRARQGVEHEARGAGGEDGARERDVALEHLRVRGGDTYRTDATSERRRAKERDRAGSSFLRGVFDVR